MSQTPVDDTAEVEIEVDQEDALKDETSSQEAPVVEVPTTEALTPSHFNIM